MINTIEGDHQQNIKELLDYLLREKDIRDNLAIANFKDKQRSAKEQAMAENYRRFADAVMYYCLNNDA